MPKRIKAGEKAGIISGMAIFVLMTVFGGDYAIAKVFTIGIINVLTTHAATVEGFKSGMAELGYVEDKNVKYIYSGVIKLDESVMDAEIRKQLSQGMDLLVAVANGPAVHAKKALEKAGTPVLASACGKMVEIGLIEDLKHPEANVTGVQVAENMAKALEWLVMITPNAKKIYLPYNPADDVSLINLVGLDAAAAQMGVKLVPGEVRSVEEAVAAIETLPEDIDAIFRIPSQTLGPKNSELSRAAIRRGLPMGSGLPLDEDVMVTFGSDSFEMGRQTARLAHQIRQGIKPSDIPVETSEVFLTINLKTAEKIGIKIPDNILAQANNIIHE